MRRRPGSRVLNTVWMRSSQPARRMCSTSTSGVRRRRPRMICASVPMGLAVLASMLLVLLGREAEMLGDATDLLWLRKRTRCLALALRIGLPYARHEKSGCPHACFVSRLHLCLLKECRVNSLLCCALPCPTRATKPSRTSPGPFPVVECVAAFTLPEATAQSLSTGNLDIGGDRPPPTRSEHVPQEGIGHALSAFPVDEAPAPTPNPGDLLDQDSMPRLCACGGG